MDALDMKTEFSRMHDADVLQVRALAMDGIESALEQSDPTLSYHWKAMLLAADEELQKRFDIGTASTVEHIVIDTDPPIDLLPEF